MSEEDSINLLFTAMNNFNTLKTELVSSSINKDDEEGGELLAEKGQAFCKAAEKLCNTVNLYCTACGWDISDLEAVDEPHRESYDRFGAAQYYGGEDDEEDYDRGF